MTDDEPTLWRDVVAPLSRLAQVDLPLRAISADALRRLRDADAVVPRGSMGRALKHLVSSEVREALRSHPLLAKTDSWLRRTVARFGTRAEDALRSSIEGPRRVVRSGDKKPLAVALCAQQLRGVRHSCEQAKRQLGYRPEFSFATSMAAFKAWYRAHMGMDTDAWPILRQLWLPS